MLETEEKKLQSKKLDKKTDKKTHAKPSKKKGAPNKGKKTGDKTKKEICTCDWFSLGSLWSMLLWLNVSVPWFIYDIAIGKR